ncbi:hypothetical protein L6R46_01765 [Myxococcota bacterium]|nr:hypothetical protein [Myxococcota bacterium]
MSSRVHSSDDFQLELNDPFVNDGLACRVRFAEDASGRLPSKEFLDQLKAERPKEYATALRYARLIAEHGHSFIRNELRFKNLQEDGLYEIKAHQLRVLCYPDKTVDPKKTTWFLLYCVIKKTDAHRPDDVLRAKRLKEENDQRIKSKSSKK